MEVIFVDTNIFLRFLTRDEEKQYQACRKLFRQAQKGKIKLITSPLVVFELIWTLASYYQEPKEKIVEKILSLLEFPNLEVEQREIFLEALLLWQEKNIDFNDAFNFVWAQKKKVSRICSYDSHFDKLPQILRLEP